MKTILLAYLLAASAAAGLCAHAQAAELYSLLGAPVRTETDEDAGRMVDVLADPAGNIQAAVIEFGGFLGIGGRRGVLPWSELRFDHGRSPAVTVLVSSRRLRGAREYKALEASSAGAQAVGERQSPRTNLD